MSGVSNGMWRRVGDLPLGLGIDRYENSDKQGLWRFRVTRHSHQTLIEVDANDHEIREIILFCEQALQMLHSDGGRVTTDEEQAP